MRRVPAMLCLLASVPCTALEVIRDAGGEPIAPYLMRLAPRGEALRPIRTPIARPDRSFNLIKHLPIRSPSLTPGLVEARERPTRLLQPVFLVGADERSLRWLEANRERLKQLNAIGMLVQAEIIQASGEAFAAELRLRHYPVLITREGIAP